MDGINLNDKVAITLTGYGAALLNETNKRYNAVYPTLHWKTDYKEGYIYIGKLWAVLGLFTYEAGGMIPFTDLIKVANG